MPTIEVTNQSESWSMMQATFPNQRCAARNPSIYADGVLQASRGSLPHVPSQLWHHGGRMKYVESIALDASSNVEIQSHVGLPIVYTQVPF